MRDEAAAPKGGAGVLLVPPFKNMGEDDGKSACKRVIGTDGAVIVRGQLVPNLAGKVPSTVLLLEGGSGSEVNEVIPSTSTPSRVPIVKSRKQDGDGNDVDTVMTTEAASFVEDRRAQ